MIIEIDILKKFKMNKYFLDDETDSWYCYFILPENMKITKNEYNELESLSPDAYQEYKIGNKSYKLNRKQKSYGFDYNFSGTVSKQNEYIPNIISKYIDYMNSIDESDNVYNMALVNWYKNGDDYIGYHSDETRPLFKNSSICCISFGAERNFYFKNKKTGKVTSVLLENNSVVIMGGECQKYYKHSIPKSKKINNMRISITLRKFIPEI